MLLSIEDLHVSYGLIEALHGITFRVDEGEIVTLIGANGAGKSTTLMTIMRLPPPEAPAFRSGRMTFKGEDLIHYPPHKVVSRLGISLVPEGRRIFGNLTVWENLKIAAYSYNDPKKIQQNSEWIFELFPRLKERRNQMADTLSGGEQQMLAVARAMMIRAKMMLLDEPSMGLAPFLMYELFPRFEGDQSTGNDHSPRGAECPDCPEICPQGICPRDGEPCIRRIGERSRHKRKDQEGLPGRIRPVRFRNEET